MRKTLGSAFGTVLIGSMLAACGGPEASALGPIPGQGVEIPWWASTEALPPVAPSEPASHPGTLVETVLVPTDAFTEGKSSLPATVVAQLPRLVAQIKRTAVGPVALAGATDHLDHAGNYRLGLQRANALAQQLERLGLTAGSRPGQIARVTSVGDTKPLCAEQNGQGQDDPDCRARDRRVALTYLVRKPTQETS
jgi:outer membrane protein OmpA-like peptidoglycan-associated protein